MKDKRRYPIVFYAFISLFLLAVQSVQLITVYTFNPDFLLILTVIFSLFLGAFRGEIIAFFLGMSLDVMSGGLFGLNTFIFVFIAAFSELFRKAVKMPSLIVFFFYLSLMTFLKYVFYALFFLIVEQTNLVDLGYLFKVPGEILLNLFAGLLIYIIFARVDNRENYEWY
ncbi:MAG: rod shape-determining protein MreD [Brevinema sp.]